MDSSSSGISRPQGPPGAPRGPITPRGSSSSGSSVTPAGVAAPAVSQSPLSSSTQTLAVSATPRSLSLASISSEGSNESHVVEQEDIVALSTAVRAFKEALGKLRKIFNPDREKNETLRVFAHERLGDVLRILRSILEKYSPIQHNELLAAASRLISNVNGFNYEDEKADPAEFLESIDHLALAFSSRVSEYLMGDIDTSSAIINLSTSSSRTKSCDNLLSSDAESVGGGERSAAASVGSIGSGIFAEQISKEPELLKQQDIDDLLYRHDQGVEYALHRAKVWSKYVKDIMSYVDKRAQLDHEYARGLTKLVLSIRPALKDESFLPFQSIFCTALDQDLENCNTVTATCNLLQTHKFIEPLTARRNEHERARKNIKEAWHRELKKAGDALANLKRAKLTYDQRHQELAKAKEALTKLDSPDLFEKLERKREECQLKAREASGAYRLAVDEANEKHNNLLKVKRAVLQQTRDLVLQCDQTMKAATVGYFQMQHSLSARAPVQFQTLCESSRLYEPGRQYTEYVRRIGPTAPVDPNENPFTFEPYTPGKQDPSLSYDPSANDSMASTEDLQVGRLVGPTGSDTDSVDSSRSAKSGDVSPAASPVPVTRRSHTNNLSSGDELELDTDADGIWTGRRQVMSKAAVSHAFKKLKTPSRCRECDSYVYFHGFECAECGLGCHKKCLETLAIQCGHKRLPRKMTTFGVDLIQHLGETSASIPHIILKCVNEIDSRGAGIKGIYRVSGLKSRVEKLCQAFENGAHLVDLTDQNPNVIANVLKLYLRQLPEPLLTFRLYSEFIRVAKEHPTNGTSEAARITEDLRDVTRRLPRQHYLCLGVLMHHLHRVANYAYINNMPPSNLGIVFGPTLLRTSEGSASLSSLVDTVHQTRAIELLVTHAQDVFGPLENFLPPHQQAVPGGASSLQKLEDGHRGLSSPSRQSSVHSGGGSFRIHGVEGVVTLRQKEIRGSMEDEWEWETHEFAEVIPGTQGGRGASVAASAAVPSGVGRVGSTSSSSSNSSGSATGGAKIVKTTLKDYLEVELAEFQKSLMQSQHTSEEFHQHTKLRKTVSENQQSSTGSPVKLQDTQRKSSHEEVSASKIPPPFSSPPPFGHPSGERKHQTIPEEEASLKRHSASEVFQRPSNLREEHSSLHRSIKDSSKRPSDLSKKKTSGSDSQQSVVPTKITVHKGQPKSTGSKLPELTKTEETPDKSSGPQKRSCSVEATSSGSESVSATVSFSASSNVKGVILSDRREAEKLQPTLDASSYSAELEANLEDDPKSHSAVTLHSRSPQRDSSLKNRSSLCPSPGVRSLSPSPISTTHLPGQRSRLWPSDSGCGETSIETVSSDSSQDLDSAHATEDSSEALEDTELEAGDILTQAQRYSSFKVASDSPEVERGNSSRSGSTTSASSMSSSSGVCGSVGSVEGSSYVSPYLNNERTGLLTLGPSLVLTRSTIAHYDTRRTVTTVVSQPRTTFDENRLRIQVPAAPYDETVLAEDSSFSSGEDKCADVLDVGPSCSACPTQAKAFQSSISSESFPDASKTATVLLKTQVTPNRMPSPDRQPRFV